MEKLTNSSPDLQRAIELINKLTSDRSYVPSEEVLKIKTILENHSCDNSNDVVEAYGTKEEEPSEKFDEANTRTVEIWRSSDGFGFNVIGGRENNTEIYISQIIPGRAAERQGGLKKGDQLLAVNDQSLRGETHDYAVELLKGARDKVKLLVTYDPEGFEKFGR